MDELVFDANFVNSTLPKYEKFMQNALRMLDKNTLNLLCVQVCFFPLEEIPL